MKYIKLSLNNRDMLDVDMIDIMKTIDVNIYVYISELFSCQGSSVKIWKPEALHHSIFLADIK